MKCPYFRGLEESCKKLLFWDRKVALEGSKVNGSSVQLQTFIKDLTEITNDIKRKESAAIPNAQLLAPVNL